MQDDSVEECAGNMFPLSGRSAHTEYTRYATAGIEGLKTELSEGGNRATGCVEPLLFGEVEEAERWFASLDVNHADVCAKRPALSFPAGSESLEDAWDALTGFSDEVQWFVECSDLQDISSSDTTHARAPIVQCMGESCISTGESQAT
jgi:hypothetical protein